MNFKLLYSGIVIIALIGCGKKEDSQPELSNEAVARVDSLQRLAALHRGFVGRHAHGKSLKLHAHQNPSKKVRVFMKQREMAPILRAAMQKENEEREKRIKKILEERNK